MERLAPRVKWGRPGFLQDITPRRVRSAAESGAPVMGAAVSLPKL